MPRRTNRSALYTHLVRWEPLEVPGSEGRAWIKTLAKNADTGARTALIKFDSGFKQKKAVSNWPVDMYVLEGEMQCGNRSYGKDTYHYRPAGVEFGPIESPTGITRIVFTPDSKTKSSQDEVFIPDVKQVPYGKSYIDPTGTKAGVKDLRQDPVANISILIHTGWVPGERTIPNEFHVHDHMEEAFVLAGEWEDYLGDIDAHIYWMPGMYMCRPPHESWHGDSLSIKTPKTTIVRRGWVGKTEGFYNTLGKHSPNSPIRPVDFVE